MSTSIKAFNDGNGSFDFLFYHIHDIGHQIKNAQASLERGTHFDGRFAYDFTDLSLLLTTAEDEVAELMLKGVSHKALAQLDKHSDEQSLQRVSEHVTAACGQTDKIVRTDIPELRRPWFAQGHSDVSSPLILCISKEGVVYFTDDSHHHYLVTGRHCYQESLSPEPKKMCLSTIKVPQKTLSHLHLRVFPLIKEDGFPSLDWP